MDSPHEEEKIEQLRRAMYSRKFGNEIGPRERRPLEEERIDMAEDWPHEKPHEERSRLPLESLPILRAQPSVLWPLLKWALGISIVCFIGATLFFAYYLFFGAGDATTRNIAITVTGPSEVAGGEPTDMQVLISNHNAQALESATLVVSYPPGTTLNDPSCSAQTCNFTLGTIQAGGQASANLHTIFNGGAGQHADVNVQLEYHLQGSNALFVASSDYGFIFSSSPVTLSLSGNSQTVSGQPMQMIVNLSSNTNTTIPDLLLSASYPFGFKLTSADPSPTSDGFWDLGPLAPGQQKQITINGTLTGAAGDSRVFHFTAGTSDTASSSAITAPLSDSSLAVAISQPFLGLGLTVNDASSTSAINVTPGSTVTVKVDYRNNISSEITDAVVVAKLSGLPINGQLVRTSDGFYRSTDNAVLWDKTTTAGQLADLAPGDTGELSFTFDVPSSDQLQGQSNPTIDISVNASGNRVGESGVPENLQSTALQKIAIASDVQLSADGVYFTNPIAPGPSGPMPPAPGYETTYAIQLAVTNTTNPLKNAVVTATLPSYTRLLGKYLPASEKLNFNAASGVFTWNVGDVAPNVGLNGSAPREVTFLLGFTPSTSQIGTEPVLFHGITLTYTDSLTGQTVTKTVPDVTTNISNDPGFTSANAQVVAHPTAAFTASTTGQ